MLKFFHPKYKHIEKLLKNQQFLEAGEAYMELNMPKKAILAFKQGQHLEKLAQAYLKNNQWLEAAQIYLQKDLPIKAADIFFENGDFEQAEKIYRNNKQLKLLGERFFSIESYEQAAKAFLDGKHYEQAAKALLKADKLYEASVSLQKAYAYWQKKPNNPNNLEKLKKIGLNLANLLKLTQQYQKAAKLYIDLDYQQEALICFSQLKDYDAAAKLSEMMQDYDNAAVYWKLAGNLSKYQKFDAERLAKRGKLLDAAKKFLAANELSRAADLYLELNDVTKAASLYEKAKQLSSAANCYKLLGRYEKAAQLYEQSQNLKEAIACYQLTPQFDKEIFLRTQVGDYLGIAKRYIDMQEVNKALDILGQITQTSPHYQKSLPLKMKAYLLSGQNDLAVDVLKQREHSSHKLEKIDLDNLTRLSQEKQYKSLIQNYLNNNINKKSIEESLVSRAKKLQNALESSNVDQLPQNEMPSLEIMINQYPAHPSVHPNVVRYQKVQEIGRGGMGLIYKATDSVLGRTVALKILSPHFKTNQKSIDTFFREAKSAALLNHPNIVTVYDFGLQNGEYYIAMEFVEGKTLKDSIRESKSVDIKKSIKLFKQMLDALAYAHTQGIVHRDLSSTNIMLSKHQRIKVMDFGLAKLVKDLLNEQSIIGGTPSFMSPEQTLGDPIDHRTDIYSLGILLYEMLTLQLPFNKGDLGYHHLHTPAPKASERNKTISAALDQFILTCMEKKQENRFQTIAQMQDYLSDINL
ncbi:MAG TPA: protein kinase [Oligoflexia bacterium]|nr:protein kinase [Oligoflexia bacterium]HMR24791.1 protein kinase [Oligoflexia bacterium]